MLASAVGFDAVHVLALCCGSPRSRRGATGERDRESVARAVQPEVPTPVPRRRAVPARCMLQQNTCRCFTKHEVNCSFAIVLHHGRARTLALRICMCTAGYRRGGGAGAAARPRSDSALVATPVTAFSPAISVLPIVAVTWYFSSMSLAPWYVALAMVPTLVVIWCSRFTSRALRTAALAPATVRSDTLYLGTARHPRW